ncbi:hypothetical protein AYB34_00450 [Leptospira sp. ZV016]|nr:hypothetical protein AYB32_04295 [Leptospira kirschneri]KXZ33160.1 hypothetical protein AYB34_00450 [Leptospira sp. ZV016]
MKLVLGFIEGGDFLLNCGNSHILNFAEEVQTFVVNCGNYHNKNFRFDISERIDRHNPIRK